MSTIEPSGAAGASAAAAADAVGAQFTAPHDPHYERRWMALGVLVIAQIMILLDATVVNVALPSAQADLGFSDASRQWVITAYVLAFGSLLPLGSGGRRFRPQGHVHRGTAGVRDCVCCRRCGSEHRHADRRSGRPGRVRRGSRAGGVAADHGDFHRPQGAEQGVRDLRWPQASSGPLPSSAAP
jgi:MFS family permease